jgi:hypothetical protein
MEALFVVLAAVFFIAGLLIFFVEEEFILGFILLLIITPIFFCCFIYTLHNNELETIKQTVITNRLELKGKYVIKSKTPIKYVLEIQKYKRWSVEQDKIISVEIK